MSDETEPTFITASYTGKIGNIPGDQYGHEAPFVAIKEPFIGTDEERHDRQWELILECYDMYQAFKEEATRRKNTIINPVSSVPKMEEIRQEAIGLIKEQGKWFKDNKETGAFKVLYRQVTGEDFTGKHDIDDLIWTDARQLNRLLGAWKLRLTKEKEKDNG